MHLVLSGPYEVLYTTSVDIWSFGCLLLTIFIGKSGPLKQRGVCLIVYYIPYGINKFGAICIFLFVIAKLQISYSHDSYKLKI